MAIARDLATDGGTATATTLTYSHTVSGSDRFLVVSVMYESNLDYITGVTYNGVAMFRIATHEGGGGRQYLYGLIAPATGANNVVVTASTSDKIVSNAVSYTGVHQTYPIDGINCDENNGISSGSWNGTSVDTRHTDCWGILSSTKSAGGTMSAGGGSNELADGDGHGLFDSNGALGAPANESMNSFASDGTQNWSQIMLTIIPAGATIATTPMFISATIGNNADFTVVVPTGLTNSILVVCIGTHQGNITGITYNGDALTQIASGSSAFDENGDIWVLLNPDTGSNTLDISRSGGSWHGAVALVLDHVKQTTTITNVSESGSESSPDINITPSSNNNLIIGSIGAEADTYGDSNSWWLGNMLGASYEGAGAQMFRQGTAASYNEEFFLSSGQRYGLAVIALEPAPSGTDYTQSCDEVITIVDTITRDPNKAQNEVITVVDTMSKSTDRSLGETVTIVDTISKALERAFSEVVEVIDSISKNPDKAQNETFTVVDTMSKDINRSLNEEIPVVDTISSREITRSLNEDVTVVDTITKSTDRTFNEDITIVDTISKSIERSLAEVVEITDTISRAIEKVFTEAVALVDTITRDITRSFDEGVTVEDTISKSTDRSFNENIEVVDTRNVAVDRSFGETVEVTDSISKDTARSFDESFTVVDTMSKALSRSLNEVVTIVDLMFSVIPQRIGRHITALRQSGTVTALKQKVGSVILKQKK